MSSIKDESAHLKASNLVAARVTSYPLYGGGRLILDAVGATPNGRGRAETFIIL